MNINELNMNINLMKSILLCLDDNRQVFSIFKYDYLALSETYQIFDFKLLKEVDDFIINKKCREEDIMYKPYMGHNLKYIKAILVFEDCFYRDCKYDVFYVNLGKLIVKLSDFENQLLHEQLIKFSKDETTTNKRKRL